MNPQRLFLGLAAAAFLAAGVGLSRSSEGFGGTADPGTAASDVAATSVSTGGLLDQPAGTDVDDDDGSRSQNGEQDVRSSSTITSTTDRPRDASPDPQLDLQSVAVVGDSLTSSATHEIRTELEVADLRIVAIDGVDSRRMVDGGSEIEPGLDAVESIVAGGDPELWVIALGTNDVGAQVDLESFREDVEAIFRAIPDGVPVIWVDIWIRDRTDDARAANRVLRDVVIDRPLTVVVDWYSHGTDEGAITGDGVHLTQRGRELFAAEIASAVDFFVDP